jgi:predicted nucleic acid-binding protein
VIVVDASVVTSMLVYADDRGEAARAALGRDTEWAAPELWMVEVFSAIRGLSLAGKVGAALAERAIVRLPRLGIDHVRVVGLLSIMWQVRADISAYDAPYVALAALRRLTLVTADARLARTATRHCAVELVTGGGDCPS